jgi:hypothetical protein
VGRENFPHGIDWSSFTGPEFELPNGLMQEHFDALNGATAYSLSILKELCIEWVVDNIHNG